MAKASQQFKITRCDITADRLGGFDGRFYDVRQNVLEINLYESLDKAYLTGSIVLLDDKSFFEKIRFRGTERIRIEIAGQDELTTIMKKTFMIVGIDNAVKSNENAKSSMVSLSLMEEHAYMSEHMSISRSFSGDLTSVIGSIFVNDLKRNIDLSYVQQSSNQFDFPVQENIKGIIPDLTPLDAVDWLLRRATTKNGSPFFAYASIHDDNIRFANLESLLVQPAFNSRVPYTYNPANISTAEEQTEVAQGFTIKDIDITDMQDTLKLIQKFGVSCSYCNTNLNTGEVVTLPFSVRDTLAKMSNSGSINQKLQNVFDEEAELGGKKIDEYYSRNIHTITSSGTYGAFKSYSDEFDEKKFLRKVERNIITSHLFKNMINIIIIGTGFGVSKATVGDIMNVKIVNDSTETPESASESDTIDTERSGDYLIYDIRHTFRDTTHEVSTNICRLERSA
jgi:hypothetical protein